MELRRAQGQVIIKGVKTACMAEDIAGTIRRGMWREFRRKTEKGDSTELQGLWPPHLEVIA